MTQEHNSNPAKNISSNALLTGITAALILVSVFQAIEISRVKGYIQAQGSTPEQNTQSSSPVKTQSTGLPSQVGGC